MNSDRVTLQQFYDVSHAEMVRARLAVEDIDATIQETTYAANIGVGEAAIRESVRLEVLPADLDRAAAILKRDEMMLELAGEWKCDRCQECNEPAFELCWNCQAGRPDPPDLQTFPAIAIQPPTYASAAPAESAAALQESNPYRPVLIPDESQVSVTDPEIQKRGTASALFFGFVIILAAGLLAGLLLS